MLIFTLPGRESRGQHFNKKKGAAGHRAGGQVQPQTPMESKGKVSAASDRQPLSVPQSLTEEKISLLLQLVREELEHKAEGEKPPARFTSEALPVHVSACVLALCGWTCG